MPVTEAQNELRPRYQSMPLVLYRNRRDASVAKCNVGRRYGEMLYHACAIRNTLECSIIWSQEKYDTQKVTVF